MFNCPVCGEIKEYKTSYGVKYVCSCLFLEIRQQYALVAAESWEVEFEARKSGESALPIIFFFRVTIPINSNPMFDNFYEVRVSGLELNFYRSENLSGYFLKEVVDEMIALKISKILTV
jgi:hypothetical protein